MNPQMHSLQNHKEHVALTFAHMFYLVLRLAFMHFHPANWVCVFFGLKPRIVLISLFVMSFHKFHICCQTDPKTCGWSN